ncbi:MAG: hypothetical protein ACXWBP_00125 [Limisphaerales bacterium]
MKTRLQHRTSSQGIMLLEAIAYIAMLVLVLGVGGSLLYRAWSNNIAMRRNADDITRTLIAGELWRTDVRTATGPIISQDGHELHIPSAKGEIVYAFADGAVSRKASGQQPRTLAHVASSQMQSDRRTQVSGWRWEVELQHNRKDLQFRPLFTFEAVASDGRKK